jgi:protein required for attachment to host cells
MQKTWVVAAESSRARIFVSENRVSPLSEVEDFAHTEGRAKEQDMVSDKPGRGFDGMVEGRHGLEKQTDAKYHEAVSFAKRLAERIESGRARGEFEQLVLIAAPEFLGILRQQLGSHATRMVSKTIDKNLVQKSESEIRNYVFT